MLFFFRFCVASPFQFNVKSVLCLLHFSVKCGESMRSIQNLYGVNGDGYTNFVSKSFIFVEWESAAFSGLLVSYGMRYRAIFPFSHNISLLVIYRGEIYPELGVEKSVCGVHGSHLFSLFRGEVQCRRGQLSTATTHYNMCTVSACIPHTYPNLCFVISRGRFYIHLNIA